MLPFYGDEAGIKGGGSRAAGGALPKILQEPGLISSQVAYPELLFPFSFFSPPLLLEQEEKEPEPRLGKEACGV